MPLDSSLAIKCWVILGFTICVFFVAGIVYYINETVNKIVEFLSGR